MDPAKRPKPFVARSCRSFPGSARGDQRSAPGFKGFFPTRRRGATAFQMLRCKLVSAPCDSCAGMKFLRIKELPDSIYRKHAQPQASPEPRLTAFDPDPTGCSNPIRPSAQNAQAQLSPVLAHVARWPRQIRTRPHRPGWPSNGGAVKASCALGGCGRTLRTGAHSYVGQTQTLGVSDDRPAPYNPRR